MNILCIADPIETFNIKKDSTYLMLQVLAKNQHQLYFATIADLYANNSNISTASVLAKKLNININENIDKKTESTWYQTSEIEDLPLKTFDVILMRKDPPYNMEYIYACQLLALAQKQGVHVVNDALMLKSFSEKISTLDPFLSEFTPPTLVTKNINLAVEFVQKHQKAIIKPLDLMGGADVFLLEQHDVNLKNLLNLLFERQQNQNQTKNSDQLQTMMLQKFIPEIQAGDKRILIIGETIVPLALARIPAEHSVRGNLASGGRGVVQALSERDWAIAKKVQQKMLAENIFMAGVDVIGDYLTEINVTSPTCMQEIKPVLKTEMGLDIENIWYEELCKYLNI